MSDTGKIQGSGGPFNIDISGKEPVGPNPATDAEKEKIKSKFDSVLKKSAEPPPAPTDIIYNPNTFGTSGDPGSRMSVEELFKLVNDADRSESTSPTPVIYDLNTFGTSGDPGSGMSVEELFKLVNDAAQSQPPSTDNPPIEPAKPIKGG